MNTVTTFDKISHDSFVVDIKLIQKKWLLLLLFNEKKWLRFNEKKEWKGEEVNNKREFSLIMTNFILHEIFSFSLSLF